MLVGFIIAQAAMIIALPNWGLAILLCIAGVVIWIALLFIGDLIAERFF